MFKNYLTVAFRNLARNRAFSIINIFGLAVGLATCLLIMLYIFDELSYDKQHKNGDRLYRIASIGGENGDRWAGAPAPLAWAVKNEFPEVDEVTRLMTYPGIKTMLLRYEGDATPKQFFEANGQYVDSTFFKVFTYDFIYGNAATALTRPNSIVISERMALKFFGRTNPVGKVMIVSTPPGKFNYTVEGVFDDSKGKSHIPNNFFLSLHNTDMGKWAERQTNWASNNIFYTYVLLKEGANPRIFEQHLQQFFARRAAADLKSMGAKKTLFLQPVKDIYLHSAIGGEIAPNGNITYLYILTCIAAFILLIACINFMNLSTARSEKRAKEVGVRKVVGAERGSLVRQFLGESFMMCLLALAAGITLVSVLLPFFNDLTHKNLRPFEQPSLVLWITGLTILTGLLAGLYPALYLSSFKPITVLKGKIINSFSAKAIRKGLVVFQFSISICLVLGALVIWQQLNFLKNQNLGFNKDRQVILPLSLGFGDSESNYTAIRNELLKDPHIKSVTCGSTYPGITNIDDLLFYPEGKTANEHVDISLSSVDNTYLKTLGFTIANGRDFSTSPTADSLSIVVNERAAKGLGFTPDDAVGKSIHFNLRGQQFTYRIIGVVKDFNFESLSNSIKPYAFTSNIFGNKYTYLIATFQTTDYKALISSLEKIWYKVNPATPFEYSFLDQDFQNNYKKEELVSQIVAYFTLIAIFIACLGLFGLAAFSAEQRVKEIGVRKVLGASVTNVTVLLSKDFVKLVLVAIVIATPLGWLIMTKWLQGFAYRTPIHWWVFGAAGLGAVLIALFTVSFQSIKAAVASPVKSLRAE
jgi:putative ABC transport system permease protein